MLDVVLWSAFAALCLAVVFLVPRELFWKWRLKIEDEEITFSGVEEEIGERVATGYDEPTRHRGSSDHLPSKILRRTTSTTRGRRVRARRRHSRERAIVVVIGDVGRSPRTMNHALEFARHGVQVTLIGYYPGGSENIKVGLPAEVLDTTLLLVNGGGPTTTRTEVEGTGRNGVEKTGAGLKNHSNNDSRPARTTSPSSDQHQQQPLSVEPVSTSCSCSILPGRRPGKIELLQLPEFRCPFPKLPFFFYLIWRVLHDLWHFWAALGRVLAMSFANGERITWILLQNPPMVPQLALCKLFQTLLRCRGVLLSMAFTIAARPRKNYQTDAPKMKQWPTIAVDFHNFGFTILGLKLGVRHPLVRLLEWTEKFLSRTCVDVGFSVTEAMREVLINSWGLGDKGIEIGVLHDSAKPPGVLLRNVPAFWDSLHARGYLDELQTWNLQKMRSLEGATGPFRLFEQPAPSAKVQSARLRVSQVPVSGYTSSEETSTAATAFFVGGADEVAEDAAAAGRVGVGAEKNEIRPLHSYRAARRTTRSSADVFQWRGGAPAGSCWVLNDPSIVKVVSSTSWTADEDFSDLFHNLVEIATRLDADKRLVIFITGRGELQAKWRLYWENDVKNQRLGVVENNIIGKQHSDKDKAGETRTSDKKEKNQNLNTSDSTPARVKDRVRVLFLFLPWADYPQLLQACDYGLCMHQSSSGLDLPMKVVDMFGFGELPVICKHFPALRELVHHKKNGFVFSTGAELSKYLVDAVNNFPRCSSSPTQVETESQTAARAGSLTSYAEMRRHIHENFNSRSWSDIWKEEVLKRYLESLYCYVRGGTGGHGEKKKVNHDA